jgi:hypothetical protein
MANEFVARKGLIALSNSEVTGSLGISGDLTVSGGDIVLGTTSIFSGGDTAQLSNIDALDATTEATIEAAIDTLANLTSIQGRTITLGGNLVTQNNNVTINAIGSARTLTLNESLTVGDGYDGTITFSAVSKTLTVEGTSVVNQDLTTDASPQFTGIELSHASANTLTASSGVLSIEGNRIFHAGGTDIPVADGGTGVSSLTDKAVLISQDSGTDAVGAVALTTSGQLIIGGASGPAAGLITADDGLVVTTGDGTIELDLDLKANGGLVIESNKLALDLGASSTTGTLSVPAGGTGVATLTDGGILLGNGTGAIVSMAVLADGAMVVGDGTLDPVVEIGATLRTSIGVGTTDNVTFDTGSFTGDVTIVGNLVVQGATTQLETTELRVKDKLITLASGSTDSAAATGAGIEIDVGSSGPPNPAMTWTHAAQEFDFNYPIKSSEITGSFSGDGAGITNIVSTLTTAGESGAGSVALKTQTLTVTGGEGIDTVASNQTITISGEVASTTNKGVVELATNAETNTGTDAARVVTPAGLTAWTGDTALVTVGALDAGSISSNFGTIDIGSSALTAGSATVAGTNISGSTASSVISETRTVARVAVASYSSAQFDYSVNDGTNYRSGTVMAIWKAGTSIDYTEYSTPDIGDTSGATFVVDESGGNARLKFTVASGTWTVKIAIRAL